MFTVVPMGALLVVSFTFTGSSNPAPVAPNAVAPTVPEGAPLMSWGDFDGDGRTDIYAVYPTGDRLYRNAGDGNFTDVTIEAGLSGLTGSRFALWFDFDRDGTLDLYVVSARPDRRLFANTGHAGFVDVTRSAGLVPVGEQLDAAWLD